MTRALPLGIALLTLGAAGCPGNLDPSLMGMGNADAMPIFMMHGCATTGSCHDANGSAANFDMATPGWETHLVGINPLGGGAVLQSMCASNGPYLMVNTQPAVGLFLAKLSSPPCGQPMPLTGSRLTASELATVQNWANAQVMKGPGTPRGGASDGAAGQ